ncbi:mitochondrial fission ELM1 family protein [Jiella sonneratiae]|uniref:Mitochondrial fission ELM1 family protein n=1 Tax=Jiella sonneratiae TaxID=2816856 RepID=A0ABS3J3B3_9HYPH|nr:mitochondrial fission ELM1 family protein [Jiella sonneratiae]MBO0904153.1 mitochondrial fission ELM1 family protein [Jiella sonneratiae]
MTAADRTRPHVWTVSEVKAGTLTQCLGVARFIDPDPHVVTVRKEFRWWKPTLSHLFDLWRLRQPDVIISCGGQALSHTMLIAGLCRRRPLTVHLAGPKPEYEDRYDLVFVSRHDWTSEREKKPNFHPMIGVPHRVDTEEMEARRPAAKARLAPQEGPVATVLVGGPNKAYHYDEATVARLVATIRGLAAEGWTVLVSTSRRSPAALQERLAGLGEPRIVIWDRQGENPFRDYLAAADALVITKDSVTMLCEALATGKPVYAFDLAHRPANPHLDKFERYHADMSETLGLTRRFEGSLAPYAYDPPQESRRIASMVEARLAERTGRIAP